MNHYFDPTWVVNLCFVVVMVCSTVLTWREVIVLENAYAASQRSALENVGNALDMQMQVSVDRLLFFRNGMQAALRTPIKLDILNAFKREFDRKRTLPQWQIGQNYGRTLPVYGVSDAFVNETELLNRENEQLHNELTAAIELGYLFRLADSASMLPRRAIYLSRAGFFISTRRLTNEQEIIPTYYRLLMRPWFGRQQIQENRDRGVRWFSDQAQANVNGGYVTASVPLDYNNYWFGVLVMSFPINDINLLLTSVQRGQQDREMGEYQLYDAQLKLLTSTLPAGVAERLFTAEERASLQKDMANDTVGGLRLGARYVSWQKLKHFDGVLLRIHTLREGFAGDFGRISIAMAILWLLFMAMLMIAWGVIRRMVKNMYGMQNTLQWQAWYDPLTRLYNRGALFERAKALTLAAQTNELPFAIIQLDLDNFKDVNDRYGHQAGDLVLSHTAGLISSTVSEQDIAGRVGGEEFCILLPGCTLVQAAHVAERIRARIGSKEILIHKHITIRISASFGVSDALENNNYDFEFLQSVADRRLYQAKNNGRNQVCYTDEVPKK